MIFFILGIVYPLFTHLFGIQKALSYYMCIYISIYIRHECVGMHIFFLCKLADNEQMKCLLSIADRHNTMLGRWW